jgi:hypothetical protein
VDVKAGTVSVTQRQFPGADHSLTHAKPAEVARATIGMIGDLLRKAYTDATVTTQPRRDTSSGGTTAPGMTAGHREAQALGGPAHPVPPSAKGKPCGRAPCQDRSGRRWQALAVAGQPMRTCPQTIASPAKPRR